MGSGDSNTNDSKKKWKGILFFHFFFIYLSALFRLNFKYDI
jgi:hypothetical protein